MNKKWIQGAIKHPGALHRDLGVPQGQKIPPKKLAGAAHSDDPTVRKRAQFAQTLKGFNRADGGKLVKVHFCDGGKNYADGGMLSTSSPGVMPYADGGKVPAPEPPKKPDPSMLGTGLAAKAGELMKNRKSKLDKAIEDAGG